MKNCDDCIGMGMIRDAVEDVPEAAARICTWHTCATCGGSGEIRTARRPASRKKNGGRYAKR